MNSTGRARTARSRPLRIGENGRGVPSITSRIRMTAGSLASTLTRTAGTLYFEPLVSGPGPTFIDTPVLILGETTIGLIAGLIDTWIGFTLMG